MPVKTPYMYKMNGNEYKAMVIPFDLGRKKAFWICRESTLLFWQCVKTGVSTWKIL